MITSRAIIFKAMKYGESSLIVEAYTEQKGLRKYIVGGVRQRKSRIAAALFQVMSLVEIVAYDREDRDLNRLKEIRAAKVFRQIPFDMVRGSLGLFLMEVARKSVREREENQALFDFLFSSIVFLDESPNSLANYPLQYLLELSTYLGILPAGYYCAASPIFDLQEGQFVRDLPAHTAYITEERSAWLHELLHLNREQQHLLQIPKQARLLLLDDLLQYYRLHIEGMHEVNSLKVLKEVWR